MKSRDIPFKIKHNINFNGKFLRTLIEREGGLEHSIRVAREVTDLTNKEFSTTLNTVAADWNNEYELKDRFRAFFGFTLGNVGNEREVYDGKVSGQEHYVKQGQFYMPVAHIHTHPYNYREDAVPSVFPSEQDLKSSYQRLSGMKEINGSTFIMNNPMINVIASDVFDWLFFYQAKDNYDGYNRTIDSREEMFKELITEQIRITYDLENEKREDEIENLFKKTARKLERLGGFKCDFFKTPKTKEIEQKKIGMKEWDKGFGFKTLSKIDADKIIRKYQYEASVLRIS